MKKFFYAFILMMIVISGCTKKEDILELLNKELPYLSTDKFDMTSVLSSVEYEKDNIFKNLIDVYDYDYESLGFHAENISQAIIRISPTSSEMYMVFEPVVGKEEALIQDIKNYLSTCISKVENDQDRKLLEMAMIVQEEDYIACVASTNNQEVLDRIHSSKEKLFGTLTLAKDDDLATYGLNKEMVDSYSIGKPVLTTAKSYLIVKPKQGQEENVKKALCDYLKQMEVYFSNVSSELKLIHEALFIEFEGYQILIISKDNNAVLEAIKTYLK